MMAQDEGQIPQSIAEARIGLPNWARRASANAVDLAHILGVDEGDYLEDPLRAASSWQDYLDEMPFGEFEDRDWNSLHADVVSFLADVLQRCFGAAWGVEEHEHSPRGFRYVLSRKDGYGELHSIDPFVLVAQWFKDGKMDITELIHLADLLLSETESES